MKKFFCMLIVFALAITAVSALAEPATYTDRDEDFTFTYDTDYFEITHEEYQSEDDDDLVLALGGKVEAWGHVLIQMTRVALDLEDEEAVAADQAAVQSLIEEAGATRGEWNGFQDVLMYAYDDEESFEQVFVIPCTDDETLSIMIQVDKIEDEDAAMARDDQISAVLDTLTFIEPEED